MKIEMMPTISINDLVDEVNIQYDMDLDRHDLIEILFPEPYYTNDCYKAYYFGDGLFEEDGYQRENCVIAYLMDILPNHEKVLIDISW